MKHLYFLFLSILIFNFSFSAPVITVKNNNGSWKNNSTWNLNRKPANGDTIIIPSGKTVVLDNQQYLNNVCIKIYGTLKLTNFLSFLALNSNSSVLVYSNGLIEATVNYWQYIFIGSQTVFYANTITGPQMANSATGPGFSSFTPMPVKFIGFTAAKNNNDVLIQWSTAQEINAGMYQVERSFDGVNWNTIAYVAAVGNSANVNNYSYTDKNISAKTIYYRIKQVDVDGKFTYTPVKSIKTETVTSTDVKIYSTQNKVLLQFPQQVKGNVIVRFVSLSGQVVEQQMVNQPVGQVVLNTNVKGNCIVSVSNGQDVNVARQVIL